MMCIKEDIVEGETDVEETVSKNNADKEIKIGGK